MKELFIDIETYSDIDLAKCGVYRYVQSINFEILLFAYSIDKGPVHVVNVKEKTIVIETGADQVRLEMAKWSISTNETAAAAAKEEAKKAQEAKAKAKAAKKAEKN